MDTERRNEKYESDSRSSEELLQAVRKAWVSEDENDNNWEAMAILHYRGGPDEFSIAKRLTKSTDPTNRCIGADILGQLGWRKRTFLKESVDVLIGLLNDSDSDVLNSAAVALGHRGDSRAVEPLIKLVNHTDPQVRYSVVFGLLGHEDECAIAALIQLSADEDHDTRNWAMFGLGSQIDVDTPAIREALMGGLKDPDHEIRGEALVGLARRGDARVVEALLKEWEDEWISILSLEAAEEIASPVLAPRLNEFLETLELDDESFKKQLMAAITTCQQKNQP